MVSTVHTHLRKSWFAPIRCASMTDCQRIFAPSLVLALSTMFGETIPVDGCRAFVPASRDLVEARAPSDQKSVHMFVPFKHQHGMVRMKPSGQFRFVALLGLSLSLSGCLRDSTQAVALGCYQPTIGPAPTEAANAQKSTFGSWVKLDSAAVRDTEGAVFKLRTQANPPT